MEKGVIVSQRSLSLEMSMQMRKSLSVPSNWRFWPTQNLSFSAANANWKKPRTFACMGTLALPDGQVWRNLVHLCERCAGHETATFDWKVRGAAPTFGCCAKCTLNCEILTTLGNIRHLCECPEKVSDETDQCGGRCGGYELARGGFSLPARNKLERNIHEKCLPFGDSFKSTLRNSLASW